MSDERDSSGPAFRQVSFAFPARRRYDRASFHASASNRQALDFVDRWPNWPSHAAAVFSASGGGKTHLLHIWADRAQAVLINGAALDASEVVKLPLRFSAGVDDADQAAATESGSKALFHVLNRAQQEGGYVFMTGERPPAHWPSSLPDLRTRLAAAPAVEIEPPDDALMAAALTKSFADHQLVPPPNLVTFVVTHMERDFSAAEALVEAMDRETIGTGKMLSVELAARLIEDLRRD